MTEVFEVQVGKGCRIQIPSEVWVGKGIRPGDWVVVQVDKIEKKVVKA